MKLILACALACALSTPATFAASPWDGTWKLDMSKSHYEGETFTYAKKPNGLWNFSNGSTVSFDFGTDGKPYKTVDADDTTTTTMDNDHSWTYIGEFKGKAISKTHQEISADGKTMTEHNTSYRPDGTQAESDTTYTRVSGTTGFAGKWKSTKVASDAPESFVISTAADGTVTWMIPSQKATVTGHLDGKPNPIKGPTSAAGLTLAMSSVSPRSLTYKVAIQGKPLAEGKMTLAADGKSYLDTSWSPGKESEKSISFYARQ